MAAAVLAGGRSRRMGTDKAVLDVGGVTLVERSVQACRAAGAAPVAVVGHRRPETLPAGLDAVLVDDLHPGEGPLGGVLSALAWSPAPTIVVVACDLPYVPPSLLRDLVARLGDDPTLDVALARSRRGVEPLVGAWCSAAADALHAVFAGGRRAVLDAIDGLAVATVAADDRSVANVNRPSDLDAARGGHGRWGRPG